MRSEISREPQLISFLDMLFGDLIHGYIMAEINLQRLFAGRSKKHTKSNQINTETFELYGFCDVLIIITHMTAVDLLMYKIVCKIGRRPFHRLQDN